MLALVIFGSDARTADGARRESMEISPDKEIYQVLKQGSLEVLGKVPKWVGGSGWMDTQIIHGKGIPAVAFGPKGFGAHGAEEWIDLDSVYRPRRSRSTSSESSAPKRVMGSITGGETGG